MTASHLGPIPPRGPPLSRTVSGHAPTRFGDEAEVEEVEEELEEYGSDYGDLEDNGFDGNEACVDPELQEFASRDRHTVCCSLSLIGLCPRGWVRGRFSAGARR